MIRLIRLLGAALGALIGIGFVIAGVELFEKTAYGGVLVLVWTAAWITTGFLILPYLTIVPAGWLVRAVQAMSTAEFVAAIVGLLLGLLMGLLLGLPLSLSLPAPYGTWLPLGISVFLGLGMLGLTVAKRADLVVAAEAAGFIKSPRERRRDAAGGGEIVVDTSSIIDGRIADIVDAGFLYGSLVIPRFVLDELQRIADSSDAQRRGRGRRGLDILARLQKDGLTPVEIVDDDPRGGDVDAKLVAVAKARGAAILTNDFNLNRVAELQSVRVLNINSLANALKPALLPGDDLRIKVITEGKEPGQGVGYLDDGTMVVVEGGAKLVDHDVDVQVTRVLQTVMGRMIFAQRRPE